MSIFKKLFVKTTIEKQNLNSDKNKPEHAVIVYFNYKKDNLESLHNLEAQLEKVIAENRVGEYDGHEISTDYNDGILYMYGTDAEKLYKTVQPTLKQTDFMGGATAKLRFGPPGDGIHEIEVMVSED